MSGYLDPTATLFYLFNTPAAAERWRERLTATLPESAWFASTTRQQISCEHAANLSLTRLILQTRLSPELQRWQQFHYGLYELHDKWLVDEDDLLGVTMLYWALGPDSAESRNYVPVSNRLATPKQDKLYCGALWRLQDSGDDGKAETIYGMLASLEQRESLLQYLVYHPSFWHAEGQRFSLQFLWQNWLKHGKIAVERCLTDVQVVIQSSVKANLLNKRAIGSLLVQLNQHTEMLHQLVDKIQTAALQYATSFANIATQEHSNFVQAVTLQSQRYVAALSHEQIGLERAHAQLMSLMQYHALRET